jgi:hypothetical protein
VTPTGAVQLVPDVRVTRVGAGLLLVKLKLAEVVTPETLAVTV